MDIDVRAIDTNSRNLLAPRAGRFANARRVLYDSGSLHAENLALHST